MFTFVQARRGSFSLKKTTFNIKETLQNVFDYFDTIQFNDDLRLTLKLGDELPEWIVGDEKKISLVVVQLMKNACSFTHKGEVTLFCEAVAHVDNAETFRFSVKDTGAGISKEKQAEIFVAFNQVDNSINREHGGMGIGLTIVNDLLSLMSAKLSLVSELGEGATFLFEIPITRASEMEIAQVVKEKTNTIHHMDFDHSKILVVEDNPVNMKLLCKVLEKSNYQPLSAINGEEALIVLEKNPDISAILMDCQMPVMDGFQATRAIRNIPQYSNLPIIAVTANVSEEDQQRCRDVGMSDYLSKPVKKTQIESMLIKWLKKA
jgi:CheY-like chemotaxis protein